MLKTPHGVDLDKLRAHLYRSRKWADRAQAVPKGRVARGVTMLANSRDELSRQRRDLPGVGVEADSVQPVGIVAV